ncbi:MAG: AMP-binding protein [Deltaproteobacteria bacterium]|nr:AMP-binding protein [Deltaproteobacteria bacterium]
MGQSFNIGADLRAWAERAPARDAIRFMVPHAGPGRAVGTSLSFAALERLSNRYARGFAASGVARGDTVLVLAKPSLDFYAFMFGLFKLGAVPVLMDPGMGFSALLKCIEQIGPKHLVAIPVVHAVRQVRRRPFRATQTFVTVGRRWFWGGASLEGVYRAAGEDDTPFAMADFDAGEEACIIFTSGSTGTPKGVSLTHGAFSKVVRDLTAAFSFTEQDRWMDAFAAFVFFDVCAGMTAVVVEGNLTKPATIKPEHVVQAIQEHQCTGAFASPIVWAQALRYMERQGLELPSLQRAVTTGAPIAADMHRRFQAVVEAGVQLHTPYGATECLTTAHIASDEILGETWERTRAGHGTCVGRPYPGTAVHIIRLTEDPLPEWSDELLLPVGEIGEIVAETPVASPEYKGLPEANAAAKIRKGDQILHRMGDLGYQDEQGRLWFCGRKAHRLETAEGVVPAVPVEGIFNEHPAVFRTALVGMGPRGAEIPVLLVESEQGATWTEEELLALAVGTRWEGLVKAVAGHPGFPTDARHNSKIRREDLKAWAENHLRGKLPG